MLASYVSKGRKGMKEREKDDFMRDSNHAPSAIQAVVLSQLD